jgi:hypothetical protein
MLHEGGHCIFPHLRLRRWRRMLPAVRGMNWLDELYYEHGFSGIVFFLAEDLRRAKKTHLEKCSKPSCGGGYVGLVIRFYGDPHRG